MLATKRSIGIADDPQIYAEAILNVCRLYIESPLRCVSGVTGSDLKKRIREIMTGKIGGNLTFAKKAALAVSGIAVIAMPIAFGLTNAAPSRAQSREQGASAIPSEYRYEVASIKPDKSDKTKFMRVFPDGYTAIDYTLLWVIKGAYGIYLDDQFSGVPNWLISEEYDVEAKMDSSTADELKKLSSDDLTLARRHMLQALLADRLKLAIHRESKDLPVYFLVLAKSGSKLHEARPGDTYPNGIKLPDGRLGGRGVIVRSADGGFTGQGIPIAGLAEFFSLQLGRPIVDKTGLTGKYDFTLRWAPDESQALPGGAPNGQTPVAAPDPNGSPLFTAISEQLGLKLESGKGPVEVIVIDHVERPSGN